MKNKILQYIQQNKRKAWVSFLVKLEPAVIAHWKEYKYRIVERISKLYVLFNLQNFVYIINCKTLINKNSGL